MMTEMRKVRGSTKIESTVSFHTGCPVDGPCVEVSVSNQMFLFLDYKFDYLKGKGTFEDLFQIYLA